MGTNVGHRTDIGVFDDAVFDDTAAFDVGIFKQGVAAEPNTVFKGGLALENDSFFDVDRRGKLHTHPLFHPLFSDARLHDLFGYSKIKLGVHPFEMLLVDKKRRDGQSVCSRHSD